MPLYIEKKLIVTSTNRPTDQPTNRVNIEQSASGRWTSRVLQNECCIVFKKFSFLMTRLSSFSIIDVLKINQSLPFWWSFILSLLFVVCIPLQMYTNQNSKPSFLVEFLSQLLLIFLLLHPLHSRARVEYHSKSPSWSVDIHNW